MAEKVRDRIDGFHFPVGSAVALASLVKRLVTDRSILEALGATLAAAPLAAAIVETHMQLYRQQPGSGLQDELPNKEFGT